MSTYQHSANYWDEKWAFGEHRRERVFLDGSDGEEEFDQELRRKTGRKHVLDIGCGDGRFTLKIAKVAKHVTGVDTSRVALAQAKRNLARSQVRNVGFRYGSASDLPFSSDGFDVVYSRRGPGSETMQNISEAYRVLKRNGCFMQIEIGERDKQDIARIFGRGQMLHVKGQVSDNKKRLLKKVGFRNIVTRDYVAAEVFHDMRDLLVRLQSAPIIPSFNPVKDRKYLAKVEEECSTDRGIETPIHRVVVIGRK